MDGVKAEVTERAVVFGPRNALVGIVTQPVQPDPNLPAVIALNGGILPRSGQGRIYVTLSRRLAALGYRVLRFDLSGIGDSPSRGDGLPPFEASVADIGESLDWFVGEQGRVVLMGLCDGATLAAHRASTDRRVVGTMLIDPLIPRTPRYRREHARRRLWRRTTWVELLNGKHPVWRILHARAKAIAASEEAPAAFDPNDAVVRAALQQIYQGLVDNEVSTFALFTGGMQHRHCYREQLLDAFPGVAFNDLLRLEYFDANDHHFEWPPHRALLLDLVVEWISVTRFRGLANAAVVASAGDAAPDLVVAN